MHACIPSTSEAEAGGLLKDFKSSLGYIERSCLKKTNKNLNYQRMRIQITSLHPFHQLPLSPVSFLSHLIPPQPHLPTASPASSLHNLTSPASPIPCLPHPSLTYPLSPPSLASPIPSPPSPASPILCLPHPQPHLPPSSPSPASPPPSLPLPSLTSTF